MKTMANIALEARNLSRVVMGKVLVNNISVQVQQGEVLAIVGPSGAGKSVSTLFICRAITTSCNILVRHISPALSQTEFEKRRLQMKRIPKFPATLKIGFILFLLLGAVGATATQTQNSPVKNIVLVHGAWADGSGWKGVYDILTKHGYKVSMVQEPETTFKEDVAATKRILDLQNGPCILVAHSYGGAVITEAGNHSSVIGLVYIAAHMPDAGESEAQNGLRFPSDLSKSTAIKKTADNFTYLDPAQFHEYFAADLPAEQAAFMARSQVFNLADNFKAVITKAAWRTKPSWMLVAGSDRTINPELERWYAQRAKSQMVEVKGASHVVYISHPKEVAALIQEAATQAK